ncbi:MAG: DNA gyrase subunit A [Deltaproteobacteria bacterium]|nr:DNA gyrase subunit A [Deltaproteobacteria bacterium]
MDPFAASVVPIRIEDELKNSYMDYSMSVIIGRALPDVRDGLKPVHRRILFAMHQEGLTASHKYSKCAGVVGEVLKKYHPHGDSAVYDSLVRMAQPWNLRYPLVDGQGNFGSVDGDPAAAYRYTECRMTRLAGELLLDIEKETVSFSPNFDGEVEEPDVLPAAFPNLLVNGADGIAVGMATKIPPHNLREVINAAIALIEEPGIDLEGLMRHVIAPDFPTGGTIYGKRGVYDAYREGRGKIVVRGVTHAEVVDGRHAIIVDEIPYQVNKARLIEQIAELVKERKLEGIHALRDESDRQGMRVVMELKHDAFPEVVLNHLYKHTTLQSTFGVIMLAIVNQRPMVLSLKEMLQHYLAHRREVVIRRTRFDLRKARERAHILEGYLRALDLLDEIIRLIRASAGVAEARSGLIEVHGFSEIQANAILELRLQRLTGMERQKIIDEYAEVTKLITYLEAILGSESRLMEVVKSELVAVRDRYGDDRRTRIVEARSELTMHDLVAEEDQVVTVTQRGYVKRCSPDEWRTQRRGGTGKLGMSTRDEDFVTSLFIANTHSTLLVFTDTGKVYPLPVYELPESGRAARGRPIVNLVPVAENERIAAVVTVREEEPTSADLLFVSKHGIVKRTPLAAFRNLRAGGMIAAGVNDDDELLVVRKVEGENQHLLLFSQKGKCIRCHLAEIPELGRSARGNHGIKLEDDDIVVDALVISADMPVPTDEDEDDEEIDLTEELPTLDNTSLADDADDDGLPLLLTITEHGFGKRTGFDEYRLQRRYGKGILSFRVNNKTGRVVGALVTAADQLVMLVTNTGRVIRILASGVRKVGRVTQGVRLMRLETGERLVDLALLEEAEAPLPGGTGPDALPDDGSDA